MERKLISIKDAAKMLGVSSLTLRNWDKNGKLRALRHPMNNYRVYKVADIESLIDNMTNQSVEVHTSTRSSGSNRSNTRKLNVLHLER
jgi:DNA (cytosine-5)-methyltransferase 1